MNGLLGAMTTLLHPEHGRYGVELHGRDYGGGDSCTIKSGNNTNNRNNNKNNNDINKKNNRSDDDSRNYDHTLDIMTEPGIVSEKWSSSQACKTSYAQSKGYDTGKKKPDGIDDDALVQKRSQSVCNVLTAK